MHCPICGSQLVWEIPLETTPGMQSVTGLSCPECGSRSVALLLIVESPTR